MRLRAVGAALAAGALVSGCGGATGDRRPAAGEPGPVHIHGLGVDPADGALYIATHTGLWRSPEGSTTAVRVGGSRQDTMGFAVVGPGRFLGSGHPDPLSSAPPHLGLIRSDDAGRSWTNVSLAGRADFHVLRVRGRHVYGWDATRARLLASADGGETWDERESPGDVFDLALHPRDPRHLVASTASGIAASRDGGMAWKHVVAGGGLLAWPEPRSLYVVGAGGAVARSSDGGRRWRRVSEVGGDPAAFVAGADGRLYVALHDGRVLVSEDGRRWHERLAA